MKTIDIAESIEHLVPKELKNLLDVRYSLTKTENFRNGFVFEGDTVTGPLSIVNIVDKPGVKVINDNDNVSDKYYRYGMKYIRTSPIVKILDSSETTVTFQTEGGVYKLEMVVI